MTVYDDTDQSIDSSRPGELFQFSGGIQAYYTNAPTAVTLGGIKYEPEYIQNNTIEQTEELNKQQLEITVRASNPVAKLYIKRIPIFSVSAKVFRYIEGISEHRLIWAGKVAKAVFNSDSEECVLYCDPIFSMLKRAGLRRNYQILCPYNLYGPRCGAIMNDYTSKSDIESVQGSMVKTDLSSSYGNNWFTGGILIQGNNYHFIINHTGGNLYLDCPLENPDNTVVRLVPGCNKTFSTCASKFSMGLNFGGFPYIPTKNPFTGDSMAG
jgi:uncharacterized phage protein (TIGR02218 family)